MESFGNFIDDEWNDSIGSVKFAKHGLMSSQYDLGLNFPNLFLHAHDVSNNSDSFVVDEELLVNVSDNINPNFYHFFAQENSITSSDATNNTISRSYPCNERYPFPTSNTDPPSNDVRDQFVKYCTLDEIRNSFLLPAHDFSDGGLYVAHDLPISMDDEVNKEKTDKNTKKRVRVSKENKNKKNMQQRKKNTKMNDSENENNNYNGEKNGQSSSSCSSNDDLNGSQEMNEPNVSNGKTRASRGTATDPQSLYARKRRERINERLRILQTLVPNGTKVDISTMLEEAVVYVKFLKLQIQLLSSDDTWMYAPIAYNGMDMGL